MEEVEKANKAAIESCHRFITLLSLPKDQIQNQNLMVEAEESVFHFKRVVSLLSHARVRKSRNFRSNLPQNIFLDSPNCTTILSPKPLQILLPDEQNQPFKFPPQNPQQIQFFHHQQQQMQKLQQFQMKYQPDIVYSRGNSGINLKFDGAGCTPTTSSTRSFISSLSMDGEMDGNSFSFDRISQQSRRMCSKDGSLKCGGSGKCHCSKKRKLRIRRSIKVPAISNKVANIPPDEYSWRKYGQKPIKGSPHPRGYYK